MKKILAVLAALTVLLSSAAMAEDLSSLTDRELMKLYLDVMDEMRSRTATEQEEAFRETEAPDDAEYEADMDVISRLCDFFTAWQNINYDDMIELCTPEWKSKNDENPRHALFSILQNRTPESVRVETVSGSSADSQRYLNILVPMNYSNKEEPLMVRMTAVMVRGEDGLWYIDPECLLSYKLVTGN